METIKKVCHYITIVLPRDVDLNEIRDVVNKFKLAFEPIKNHHIIKQLGNGEQYLRATNSSCDCGTVIGALASDSRRSQDLRLKNKIACFRREGWSKTKINRWLEQQEQNKKNKTRNEKQSVKELAPYAKFWIDFLNKFINDYKILYIGLLLHWYQQSLESERIAIKERVTTTLNNLDVDYLVRMNEDILYLIENRNN